jgi:DNA repair protein SbcD/Mre11
MVEPVRVLHFADLHVGMENYGRLDPVTGTSSRVRDFLSRLDEVVDYALSHDADLAVFAGDAFKNRDPDPTQQREFAQRIKRLADRVPTLLLIGNHDMPGMAVKASSVDIFQALDVPGVIVGQKPEGRVVATRRGPVYLAWMPYPMRNRLLARDEHAGKSIEELELELRRVVSDILRGLAEEAAEQPMPRLLAGHFSVAEARLGSERTVMLGRDVAVATSALSDAAWDYVALGHIHRHQDLAGGGAPPIVYSGSLERIDFGEEHEAKGFCWVELGRGTTTWQFIAVDARPFRTVRVDARASADPTEAVLASLDGLDQAGAVVRIMVTLHDHQQAAFREREVLAALAEAASVNVVREVESEARARLGDLAPEALGPIELLQRYFESRKVDNARLPVLLEKAEELLRDPD